MQSSLVCQVHSDRHRPCRATSTGSAHQHASLPCERTCQKLRYARPHDAPRPNLRQCRSPARLCGDLRCRPALRSTRASMVRMGRRGRLAFIRLPAAADLTGYSRRRRHGAMGSASVQQHVAPGDRSIDAEDLLDGLGTVRSGSCRGRMQVQCLLGLDEFGNLGIARNK